MAVDRTRAFRAMGSDCVIRVWCDAGGADPDDLLASSVALVEDLEQRWSRFRVDSELTRINRHAGVAVPVSMLTLELVDFALAAWQRTDGRFDPTVGNAVVAAGYDRSFDQLGSDSATGTRRRAMVPGCAGVVVDRHAVTVGVPTGVSLDLGGIGKGRAADLVATRLMDMGARGAAVDLGGDVRTIGRPPEGDRWVVAVEDPDDPDHTLANVAIAGPADGAAPGGGAVATSSTLRRRWQRHDGPAHHLIDPATGRPSTSTIRTATVLAAEALWAEVFAKAALLAGATLGCDLIEQAGLVGLLVSDADADENGDASQGRRILAAGDLTAYLADPLGSATVGPPTDREVTA